MSDVITTREEIPTSKVYVTCRDTFMSGWGKATDKDNILILPCDTKREAQIVADNASNRTDQENVKIHNVKPRLRKTGAVYSLMNKADAARWYQDGSW